MRARIQDFPGVRKLTKALFFNHLPRTYDTSCIESGKTLSQRWATRCPPGHHAARKQLLKIRVDFKEMAKFFLFKKFEISHEGFERICSADARKKPHSLPRTGAKDSNANEQMNDCSEILHIGSPR